MGDAPMLPCHSCGYKLIPPTGRGRMGRDENFVWHRDACKCRWCDWAWEESADVFVCLCGAVSKVAVDDDHAYSVKASAPPGKP